MKFSTRTKRFMHGAKLRSKRRLDKGSRHFESLEQRNLLAVLLHSSLDDLPSIASPDTGIGGTTTLTSSDFVTSQVGSGARFATPEQVISFPAANGDDQNIDLDQGEIELWYRPEHEAEDSSIMRQIVLVGSAYDVPRLALTHWDRLSFTVLTSNWENTTVSSGYREDLWDAGEWVHIRANWNNSHPTDSLRLFVNGERIDSRGAAGGWSLGEEAAIGQIFVGAGNDTGNHFSAGGTIDELLIHDVPQRPGQPEGNTAPELAPIDNKTIDLGESVSFTATAFDVEGDALAFSLDEAPAGAVIDANSGDFSWTPDEQQEPGSYRITVRVSDNGSPSRFATATFSVRVIDPDEVGIRDASAILQPADLPLPEVGVPFVDPVFGTTMRRVSDTSDRGGWESQIYNQLQAFSADNEYLLLVGSDGYVVRRVDDLSPIADLNSDDWNAPRWHPTRPDVIVHYDSNADRTLRVQFTNVETLTTNTVFTFPSPFQRIVTNPSFDELSHDGRWMAGLATQANGPNLVFSVDLENSRLGVQRSIPDFYELDCEPDPQWGILTPDWIGVSPLGNYLTIQWTRDGTMPCSGLETYEINTGEFVGRATEHRRHGDLGLDDDGVTEVFMTTEFNAPPPFDSNIPITTIHELPGTATGFSPSRWLQSVPWTDSDHYSMQGPPGVGLVSWGNFDQDTALDAPFEDELFLQYTDGTVRRLVHHRSSVCGYWVQPRATMSRDGRYVVFASDWGRQLDCPGNGAEYLGRGDPYIIDLKPDQPDLPNVDDVQISGSGWAVDPFSIVNDESNHPLGWVNLDTIQLVFDGPAPVDASLTLTGAEQGEVSTTFQGVTGNVATWSVALTALEAGLGADAYSIRFGEDTFTFAVLPGNASIADNSEDVVNRLDLLAVAEAFGREDTIHRADVNGDGWVQMRDFFEVAADVDDIDFFFENDIFRRMIRQNAIRLQADFVSDRF